MLAARVRSRTTDVRGASFSSWTSLAPGACAAGAGSGGGSPLDAEAQNNIGTRTSERMICMSIDGSLIAMQSIAGGSATRSIVPQRHDRVLLRGSAGGVDAEDQPGQGGDAERQDDRPQRHV